MKITVDEFMQFAGISRDKYFHQMHKSAGQDSIDHVIELQMIVAALNSNRCKYSGREWATNLANYFNQPHNLKPMPRHENEQKGIAVHKYLEKGLGALAPHEKHWIKKIRTHWSQLRSDRYLEEAQLHCFKKSLNEVLHM